MTVKTQFGARLVEGIRLRKPPGAVTPAPASASAPVAVTTHPARMAEQPVPSDPEPPPVDGWPDANPVTEEDLF